MGRPPGAPGCWDAFGRKRPDACFPNAPPRPSHSAPRQSATLWIRVNAASSVGPGVTETAPSRRWKIQSPPPSPSRRMPSLTSTLLAFSGRPDSATALGSQFSRNSLGDVVAGGSAVMRDLLLFGLRADGGSLTQ